MSQYQRKLMLLQVTPEQIQAAVANAIDKDRARLLEDRYHASTNGLLGAVRAVTPNLALPRLGDIPRCVRLVTPVLRAAQARAEVKWAPAAELKQELDRQIAALLGPKTEADMQKPDAKKKKAKVRLLPRSALWIGIASPQKTAAVQRVHGIHT